MVHKLQEADGSLTSDISRLRDIARDFYASFHVVEAFVPFTSSDS